MASFLSFLPAVSARPIPTSAFSPKRPLFQTPPALHFKNHRFVIQSPLPTSQLLPRLISFFRIWIFLKKKNIFFIVVCYLLLFRTTWSYKLVYWGFCLFGDGWCHTRQFEFWCETGSNGLLVQFQGWSVKWFKLLFWFFIFFISWLLPNIRILDIWFGTVKNLVFSCYIGWWDFSGCCRLTHLTRFNDLPWTISI